MSRADSKLQKWANKNEPDDKMLWKKGYWDQIMFVRDDVARALTDTFKEWEALGNAIKVVSTHGSKSILLPVYQFTWKGIKITMRDNFYDWKISIESPEPLDINFMSLFSPTDKYLLDPCYCEGFPPADVHGTYNKSKKNFTFMMDNRYELFTFFWILKQSLYPKKFRTK